MTWGITLAPILKLELIGKLIWIARTQRTDNSWLGNKDASLNYASSLNCANTKNRKPSRRRINSSCLGDKDASLYYASSGGFQKNRFGHEMTRKEHDRGNTMLRVTRPATILMSRGILLEFSCPPILTIGLQMQCHNYGLQIRNAKKVLYGCVMFRTRHGHLLKQESFYTWERNPVLILFALLSVLASRSNVLSRLCVLQRKNEWKSHLWVADFRHVYMKKQ